MPEDIKQVTGNEQPDEIEQLLRKIAKEEVEAARKVGGDPGDKQGEPTARPIKVNVKGQEFTFDTEEKLAEFLTNVSDAAQQLKTQAATAAQPKTPAREVSGDDVPQFDNEKWLKLLGEKPLEAFKYQLDSALGFEGSLDAIKATMVKAAILERQIASYQFLQAHKEFKGGEDADTIYGIVQQMNLPYTYEGLEMAHALAAQRGLLKSAKAAATNETDESNVTPIDEGVRAARVKAPPRLPKTGAAQEADILNDVEDLSIEQLTKMLNKAHAAGVR